MTRLSHSFSPERLSQLIADQLHKGELLHMRIASNEGIGSKLLAEPTNQALQSVVRSIHEDHKMWHDFNAQLLSQAFTDRSYVDRYLKAAHPSAADHSAFNPLHSIAESIRRQILELKSIRGQLPLVPLEERRSPQDAPRPSEEHSNQVFIVHGHDDARKEEVALTIEQLFGKRPIILHEQPDGGKTIIEKLEHYAGQACFAVAILTADDKGGINQRPPRGASRKQVGLMKTRGMLEVDLKPRARQNVVLELGYFWAKLARKNVVILHEPGVELPSDADGVLYKPLDAAGAWKRELAREMEAAGLRINRSS